VPLGRVDQPLWDSTGARTTRSVLRETQTRARDRGELVATV